MPAQRKISDRQIELLIEYMEENQSFAAAAGHRHHAQSRTGDKQEIALNWEELATNLNAVAAGMSKPPRKWKDYWNEKKYMVRKKASRLRSHAQGGTGSCSTLGALTPLEQRILILLERTAVHGKQCVRKPFDDIVAPAPPPSQDARETSPRRFNVSHLSSPVLSSTGHSTEEVEGRASFDVSATAPAPAPQTPLSTPSLRTRPVIESRRRPADTPHGAELPRRAHQTARKRLAAQERQAAATERLAAAVEAMATVAAATAHSVARIEEIMERALTSYMNSQIQ